MQMYRCPLVQQIGPVGVAYFIGMIRFAFYCVYDCGVKCPPDAADLIYQYVWLWNFPYKCEPSIRNPNR